MKSTGQPFDTHSRRSFLRGTLAASLPFAVPSLLRAAAPPPSKRLNLAVIGTGGQGSGHAAVWASLPESRLVAVCDVNRQHAEQAKAKADSAQGDKTCAIYHDFRELLARADIDAVSIAIVLQRPLRWDGARERFIDDPVADRLLTSPLRAPWTLNA